MSHRFRLNLAAIIASCLALLPAGCEKTPATTVSTEPVRIFATVHTLGDLARQVGGKYVEVDFGVENGRSLANLQPSAQIIQRKTNAQLVIAGGNEPWALSGADNPREATRVIRLDGIRQQIRGQAPAKQPLAHEVSAEVGLEWLDPAVGQQTADELARRLAAMRPSHEIYFTTRARGFGEQINDLIDEYTPRFRAAPRRRVMALSHEFDFLAERFNVDIAHVIGTTPDRIGEEQIGALRRASREEHLVTLLIRVDTPPGLVQDLAHRTGLRMITMDPYGSSSANGRDNYLALLRYNMDQLLDAVGGKSDRR
jgi:ABC-type Zn uptake system ZnuABC Zn-binding protein ZnuA